jgi:RNA polymerase sigma-70 factor (ECF subfamily)
MSQAHAIASTVRLAAQGDEVAFARLVADHHPAMARVAFAIVGNVDSARDAVQSAWTIAWRRLGSLREPEQVRAWLVAIAANEARQLVRRERRLTVTDISASIEPAHDSGDPSGRITALDLERVLGRLKPEDRTLVALRFAGGLDSNEIALHLGMSASGVRSRLDRVLDRLRADLDAGERGTR